MRAWEQGGTVTMWQKIGRAHGFNSKGGAAFGLRTRWVSFVVEASEQGED